MYKLVILMYIIEYSLTDIPYMQTLMNVSMVMEVVSTTASTKWENISAVVTMDS